MSIHWQSNTGWDYAAYASIPSDGQRHEILDGEHHVNPVPNLYHQQVSRRIQFQLYLAVEEADLGVVIDAPVDVQLSDHDIVQPDLVVIRKVNRHIMTPTKVKGIPDLLIEILSPSNPDRDLKFKRKIYERCGVSEYWIVFPEEHKVLQLTLHSGVYQEQWAEQTLAFDVPPAAKVDLVKVW